jgi:poly(A) polymerase Pap1
MLTLCRWPEVMRRPPSDPAFALPFQTLSKLKPARDMYYLQRSIPDMTQYRVAHVLVKTWARSRGLYAAKFGLLGGIHISTMLVPVCKQLAYTSDEVATADILTTFFDHYASFDWGKQIVFDSFFHKELKYHRGFREPMCLLGWHAPSLNTALNASCPTAKTISKELARASRMLAREGMSWDAFIGNGSNTGGAIANQASAEFLMKFKSYVKLEAHYWGKSPMKLKKLLGWLESRCVLILVGRSQAPLRWYRNYRRLTAM